MAQLVAPLIARGATSWATYGTSFYILTTGTGSQSWWRLPAWSRNVDKTVRCFGWFRVINAVALFYTKTSSRSVAAFMTDWYPEYVPITFKGQSMLLWSIIYLFPKCHENLPITFRVTALTDKHITPANLRWRRYMSLWWPSGAK